MIDVVTTSFYIKAPSFEKNDFEHFSTELFDEWDKYVEAHLGLPDYSLSLVIEEGSIKGGGKIAATAAALYIAIGSYGSFISGVQTIREQAVSVTNALFDQAKDSFGCRSTRGNSKKSSGEIFYLKNLFERVQRGLITPDKAIDEIKNRWGNEAASSPGFLKELASSLSNAPLHPEQLSLSDESWEDCSGIDAQEKGPRPKSPRTPPAPVEQHFRIEISRRSRGEKKSIKLIKVK